MSSYVARVEGKVAEISVARVLLAVLAAPLYALGWLVGIVVVAVLWLFAAVAVGFADAKKPRRPR